MNKGKNEVLADRYADALMRLYSGEKLNCATWMDLYGVTDRTFYRDINRLGPIVEKDDAGYYELSPQFKGKLNLSDLRQFAKFVGVEPLFPNNDKRFLRALLDTLTNGSYLVKGHHYEDSSLFDSKMKKLDEIIKKSLCCQFRYNGKQRLVHPYKLINSKGIWYIAGVEQSEKETVLKAYNMNKLDQLFDTGEQFEVQPEITQKIIDEDGIWFSEEKTEVILKVEPEAAYYFTRRQLFPNQNIIKELDDGGLIFSSKVSSQKQLFPLVQYWMPHVIIISPEPWKNILKQTLLTCINQI